MRSILLFLFCSISSFLFSQQAGEFKQVIDFYNKHRSMLTLGFEKKLSADINYFSKTLIRQDFVRYMKKVDSIENVALIGALLKVKIREDLKKIRQKDKTNNADTTVYTAETVRAQKSADYPGGVNALRKKVSDLFYFQGVYSENRVIETNVVFIVEKDGSISSVQADGENFTFNRQAEIALYSVPEKFTPAVFDGQSVRYRFSIPLIMNLENK